MKEQKKSVISAFSASPLLKAEACDQIQGTIYKCINDLGFPSSTVEKPIFHMMMETAISLGHQISSCDVALGTKAVTDMQLQSYNQLLQNIVMLSQNIHHHYKK